MILSLEINVPCEGATPDEQNTIMDAIERRGFSTDLSVAKRECLMCATVNSIERRDA